MLYIYRHYRLDGAACELLLHYRELKEKKGVSFHIDTCSQATINDILEQPAMGSNIINEFWFLDVCPSRSNCEKLNELYKENKLEIMLIDHHKKNDWVKEYPWAAINTEKCSARILMEELGFNEPLMIDFIDAVEAWVLKKFESPNRKRGENLYMLYDFIGDYDFLRSFLDSFNADIAYQPLSYIVEKLRRRIQKYADDIISSQLEKAAYIMDKHGWTYKILLATEQHDKIGQAALAHSESQDLKYIVIANPINNKCSLYSREDSDIDVSKIAIELGGGGHKHAATFFTDLKIKAMHEIAGVLSTEFVKLP